MKIFRSVVPGFEGWCAPVWLNHNTLYNRLDGGVSGFFKKVRFGFFLNRKIGEEFHGIIKEDRIVYPSNETAFRDRDDLFRYTEKD